MVLGSDGEREGGRHVTHCGGGGRRWWDETGGRGSEGGGSSRAARGVAEGATSAETHGESAPSTERRSAADWVRRRGSGRAGGRQGRRKAAQAPALARALRRRRRLAL